jgi:hypothetical protein
MEPIKAAVAIEPLVFGTAVLSVLQRDGRFEAALVHPGDRGALDAAHIVFCSKRVRCAPVSVQLEPESSFIYTYSSAGTRSFPYMGLSDLVDLALDTLASHRGGDIDLTSMPHAGPGPPDPPVSELSGGVPDG